MGNKIQPLDKTVRTEFKVMIADTYMRSRVMEGSGAARVGQSASFVSADCVVTPDQKATLSNIQKVVAIQTWQPVLISLKNETGSIENIPCVDLFIMYGAIDEITIRAQSNGDPVRISYIYA
jgi:hypothetical protein